MIGVMSLSGGLDSTTLLHYFVKEKKYEMTAFSFFYGQNHNRELEMAKWQCKELGIKHLIIDISFLKNVLNSTLLSGSRDIPEGNYKDENMKQTVVPNRNMIFASIIGGHAMSVKADFIALGVHAGDHDIYPDCRKEFIASLEKTLQLADWHKIKIFAPFQNFSKGDIVKIGTKLEVDFSKTQTCYKGKGNPCEKCGSCRERIEAFEQNNLKDPLKYL